MKTQVKALPWNTAFFNNGTLLLLLFALLLALPGCSVFQEQTKEKIEPEVTIQTAEYGTVTQVTAAHMHDREVRLGDIAITVDTDDSQVLIVTQPEDDIYKVGDRVRIVRDNKGFVRVQLAR